MIRFFRKHFYKLLLVLYMFVVPALANAQQDTIYNIIDHGSNQFGKVWIHDQGDVRAMTFAEPGTNLIQAAIDKRDPHILQFDSYRLIVSSLLLHPNPQKILHIGLGGAMAPRAIRKIYPGVKQDIIEINPLVKEYVLKYFHFNEDKNTKITLADGAEFIKNAKDGEYDMVFADAYDQQGIPEHFLNSDFRKHMHRVLKKNGIAVVNTISKEEKDINLWIRKEEKYQQSFYIDSPSSGNRIIYLVKGGMLSKDDLIYRSNILHFKLGAVGIGQVPVLNIFLKRIFTDSGNK